MDKLISVIMTVFNSEEYLEETIESILGSSFNVKVDSYIKYGNLDAVIPEVTGIAYITGEHTFFIDEKDDLKHGFFLR